MVDPENLDEPEWIIPLIRAKILTLVGHSHLDLGHMEEAYDTLKEGLRNYGLFFNL